MTDLNKPEPPPIKSNYRPSWELVIEDVGKLFAETGAQSPAQAAQAKETVDQIIVDMRARDAAGEKKYGVRLQAGNKRNHLVDAYQEKLDFIVYMRSWLEENGVDCFGDEPPDSDAKRAVAAIYMESIGQLIGLRNLIAWGL